MSNYDKEYFFNWDKFNKIELEQPIPIIPNYNHHSFDFYQIPFKNGVQIYLFKSLEECEKFVSYMGFSIENCPYHGLISDCLDRITKETVKRTVKDLEELCNQICQDYENRKFLIINSPFKLSYMIKSSDII